MNCKHLRGSRCLRAATPHWAVPGSKPPVLNNIILRPTRTMWFSGITCFAERYTSSVSLRSTPSPQGEGICLNAIKQKGSPLAGDVLRNNLSNSEKRASEYRMLVCLCGPTNAMHWYSAYNCALLRRWEAGFVCSTNWNLSEFL